MGDEPHRELITYLRSQAGDYLRGVATYNAEEYSVLYLRDDLRTQHFETDLDKIHDRLRYESRAREQRAFPFGPLDGTVRLFEEAMVLHYPHTQERGTVITLDPEVGRDLAAFMRECEKRIEY